MGHFGNSLEFLDKNKDTFFLSAIKVSILLYLYF